MDEGKAYSGDPRIGALNATAAAKPSYLEQLAQEMARQRELLNILDDRLGVVSERSPQDPSEPTTDRVHISTMVSIMRRNNHDIDRLINELAL